MTAAPSFSTVPGATLPPCAPAALTFLRTLLTALPRRVALMTDAGPHKYKDVSPPTRDEFVRMGEAHLAGTRTVAATLADARGLARAGCRDYDHADETLLIEALRTAQQRGRVAFAIAVPGGGHVWQLYAAPAPAADIAADMRALPAGAGEVYPSGNCIRLPFGLHRRKRTRGVLILQDGRRFDLDDPRQLREGIAAALSLPRNAAPPPAPDGATTGGGGGGWGAHRQPDAWTGLPDGGALWHSPRIRAVARHRAQLATLLRGERVTLLRAGAPDDSDSAQVACLVYNLLGANFPEDEVRAIALHLRPRLRPGKALEHFQAQVDAEIARYRPRRYAPQATTALPNAPAPAPAPAPPAQHRRTPAPTPKRARGRPAARDGSAAGYLLWLTHQAGPAGTLLMSQSECARAFGVSLATIKRYERALRNDGLIERTPFNRRQAGRVIILDPARGVKNPREPAPAAAGNVVSPDPQPEHSDAQNARGDALEREHTPPDATASAGSLPRARARDAEPAPAPEPEPAPAPESETVRLAPNATSLAEIINAALDLIPADVSRSKRKKLTRAIVEADRGEIEDAAFDLAYRQALDVRRLLALDEKRLHREVKKRARFATRVQRDATQQRASDAQAFAAGFAYRRAAIVLAHRTGATPDDGPDGRLTAHERAALSNLRDLALEARDQRARREYYAKQLRDALPVRHNDWGRGAIDRAAAWRDLAAQEAAAAGQASEPPAPAPTPATGGADAGGGAGGGCVLSTTPPPAIDWDAVQFPFRAIWHSAEYDLPVLIVGLFDAPGPDGRRYARYRDAVTGAEGGVPVDEIRLTADVESPPAGAPPAPDGIDPARWARVDWQYIRTMITDKPDDWEQAARVHLAMRGVAPDVLQYLEGICQ